MTNTLSDAPSGGRSGGRSGSPSTGPVADAGVPAARRTRRPTWRDPRIIGGVLIVALSVLGGAKLLASADDTVAVWAVSRDLPAGTTVTSSAVEQRRVRFADAAQADRYLPASEPLPKQATLGRAVGAGELLPRAALSDDADKLVEVPLSISADDLPATVHRGSVVDVWATPDPAKGAETDGGSGAAGATGKKGGSASGTELVLEQVTVVEVPAASSSFAAESTRQVIVGVAPDGDLGTALGKLSTGRILLTRQG